jgi:hypothetical protein
LAVIVKPVWNPYWLFYASILVFSFTPIRAFRPRNHYLHFELDTSVIAAHKNEFLSNKTQSHRAISSDAWLPTLDKNRWIETKKPIEG